MAEAVRSPLFSANCAKIYFFLAARHARRWRRHRREEALDMANCEGRDSEGEMMQQHHLLDESILSTSKRGKCGQRTVEEEAAAAARASDETAGGTESAGRTMTDAAGRRRRKWWGDCEPCVALLREALLSSNPDAAVLGPLNCCYAFYMNHLHNEVLSSSYARTVMFGANVTRLESALCWMGSWRPTTALVLVYSLMGIEIENATRLGKDECDDGLASARTAEQLTVMRTLQSYTQRAELKISQKVTSLQMLIGDQDMLRAVLLDAASTTANDSSRFDQVVEKRLSRFKKLLVQAEELRFHTLKDLLSLLTPVQAARCGVTVFEVCSSLHALGHARSPALDEAAAARIFMSPGRPPIVPDAVPTGRSALSATAERQQRSVGKSEPERNVEKSPSTLTTVTDIASCTTIFDW